MLFLPENQPRDKDFHKHKRRRLSFYIHVSLVTSCLLSKEVDQFSSFMCVVFEHITRCGPCKYSSSPTPLNPSQAKRSNPTTSLHYTLPIFSNHHKHDTTPHNRLPRPLSPRHPHQPPRPPTPTPRLGNRIIPALRPTHIQHLRKRALHRRRRNHLERLRLIRNRPDAILQTEPRPARQRGPGILHQPRRGRAEQIFGRLWPQ